MCASFASSSSAERQAFAVMVTCAVLVAGNDAEVDIMTIEDEPYFSSDEEEEHRQQLHYLPVTIHKAARPADKYA